MSSRRFEGRDALVDRLAMVLLYTCSHRSMPTLQAIARGIGVSVRTARRYVESLERVGFPMPPRRADREAA